MTRKTYIIFLILSILFLNPLVIGVITLFAPCVIVHGLCVGKFMGVPPNGEIFFSIGAFLSLVLISFLSIRIYQTKSSVVNENSSSSWIKSYLSLQASLFGLNLLFLSLGDFFGHSLFTTLSYSAIYGLMEILFWVYLYYLLKNQGFGLSALLRFINLAGMIFVNVFPLHQADYAGMTPKIIRFSLLGLHIMISISLFYSFWDASVVEERLKRFRALAIVILLTTGLGVFFSLFGLGNGKEVNTNSLLVQLSVRKIMDGIVLGFYFYAFWTLSKEEIRINK